MAASIWPRLPFCTKKERAAVVWLSPLWLAQLRHAAPNLTGVVYLVMLLSNSMHSTPWARLGLLLPSLNWSNQEIPCKETWCFLRKLKLQDRQQAFKFTAFRLAPVLIVYNFLLHYAKASLIFQIPSIHVFTPIKHPNVEIHALEVFLINY